MLLMLEDDSERISRFSTTLRAIDPNVVLKIWRDARTMIRELSDFLPGARIISIDHDLEPETSDADPGDGLEVVKYLVLQSTVLPVIIHSSNRERSDWMAGEFELAGWRHWRVAPLGDDWIEVDWQRLVRRLLMRSGRNTQTKKPPRPR
jgi:hypothetical protein